MKKIVEYRLAILIALVAIAIISLHYSFQHNEEHVTINRIQPLNLKQIKKRKIENIDTCAKRILLIGDSQAYFFEKGLKQFTNQNNGHELKTIAWVSATIDQFAKVDTLSYYLQSFKPDLVLLILGTNQLKILDTVALKENIKAIEKRVEPYKWLWIGPLKRVPDLGLNEILESNIPAFHFFYSAGLNLAKKAGGDAHPSEIGAYQWGDTVATWIEKQSLYRIRMPKNADIKTYNSEKTVLKPLLN